MERKSNAYEYLRDPEVQALLAKLLPVIQRILEREKPTKSPK